MTAYVYDNLGDLPAVGPEEGDTAFVKSNSSFYSFLDLSTITSYSFLFDGNSFLSTTDSALQSFDSIYVPFTIDFWSFTDSGSSLPLLSFEVNNPITTTIDGSTEANDLDFLGNPAVLPNSPYPKQSSLYLDRTSAIVSNSTNDRFDLEPFTIQYWYRNQSPGNHTIFAFNDDNAIIKGNNNELIIDNVSFSHNYKLSFNEWQHHAITYDGYDYKCYIDGQPIELTRNVDYEFTAGNINSNNFVTDQDAGFQTKVYFPSTSSNGILFKLIDDTSGVVVELTDSGNTLRFKCRDLTITTTDFPKDDQFHIISWDIQINPKRIRLWIDGVLKGTASGAVALPGLSWAVRGGENSFIKEYTTPTGTISTSDYRVLDYLTYYGPGAVVNDPVRIEGKNILYNITSNGRRWVYFALNTNNFPLIQPGGSNVYYFEAVWLGSSYNSWVYYYASIVDPGFQFHDPWFEVSNWTGSYLRDFRNSSTLGGINQLNGSTWLRNDRVISHIIDETTNKVYNFLNGNYLNQDDFGSGNMALGPGNGYTLAFEVRPPNIYSVEPFNPVAEIQVSFDQSSWLFDPLDLYAKAPTGSTAGSDGVFGTNETVQGWPGFEDSSIPNYNLYYYPRSFKSLGAENFSLGANYKNILSDETGTEYAQNYIAETGGSIINYNGGSDLNPTLTTMNNGDALLLPPGTYSANGIIVDNISTSIFGTKNFLICGQTSNPADVIIEYNAQPADNTYRRDHPLFAEVNNDRARLAYLTYKRSTTRTASYQVALHRFSKGGRAYRVNMDFDGGRVGWLYSNAIPFKRRFDFCSFSNYSVWFNNYSGDPASIIVNNCFFDRDYYEYGITKIGDNNIFSSYSYDSDVLLNYPAQGYIKDFSLTYDIIYDSAFSDSDILFINDSNTTLFIENERYSDILLSYDNSGTVIINDSSNDTVPIATDQWVHHAISHDSTGLKVFKDGTLVATLQPLSTFSLNDTILNIAKSKVFNPTTVTFDNTYYIGSIKDFRLSSGAVQGSSFPVPSQDVVLESGDIFVTGGEVLENDLLEITNNVQSTLFSPFTSASRGWIKTAVHTSNYIDVSVENVKPRAHSQTFDDLVFEYDSFFMNDSNALNIHLSFAERDNVGSTIEWDYKENQLVRVVDIYRDSSSTNFYLKNVGTEEDALSTAILTFTAKKSGRDSGAEFFYIPGDGSSVTDYAFVEILYDRTSVNNQGATGDFDFANVNISVADSTFDLTGYTLDDPKLRSLFEEETHFIIADSLGALPI